MMILPPLIEEVADALVEVLIAWLRRYGYPIIDQAGTCRPEKLLLSAHPVD
jgi:hypothetical protein